MKTLMAVGNRVMAQSAAAGARSELYAAAAPAVAGGDFIGPDRFRENRGHPKVVHPTPTATNEAVAQELWAISEDATGVDYGLPAAT